MKVFADLVEGPIDDVELRKWAAAPNCGAVVMFFGTARDHSTGRPGVERLEYEAYEGPARERLKELANEVGNRWSEIERVGLVHRLGVVPLTEAAVVVAVSSPHRGEAFEGAKFAIDALKSTVPIWKRETWSGGESWGLEANDLSSIESSGPD